jgi:hypothetical protein
MAGRYAWTCPYCGERVWRSKPWRAGAVSTAVLPLAAAAGLVGWARPDVWAGLRTVAGFAAWAAVPFACGIALGVWPLEDADCVLSSRGDRVRWQALAVIGGGACLVVALASVAALRFGRPVGPAGWLLAGVAGLGVGVAPLFFRISWRAVAGAALAAAAVALG